MFSKNFDVLYTRVDVFFAFFSKRHVEVFERTSVGGNFRRTSLGGQNLGRMLIVEKDVKKFTESAEHFTDG